jgi:hypothetical protein
MVSVSAGAEHTCGLQDNGSLTCWGGNTFGESTPSPGTFQLVRASEAYTCGLKDDGSISCWGRNDYGELLPPSGTFTTFDINDDFGCGVLDDGFVECWGENSYGQSSPPNGQFQQVATSGFNACGVRLDGTLECWGYFGGGGAYTPPTGVFSEISAVTEQGYCGIKAGSIICWYVDPETGSVVPPATGTYTNIDCGQGCCAIDTSRIVTCWGRRNSTEPSGRFSDYSVGRGHECGVRTDGIVQCRGANFAGQATPPSN